MKRVLVWGIIIILSISCSKPKEVVQVKDLDDLLNKHFEAIGIKNLTDFKNLELKIENNVEMPPMGEKTVVGHLILAKPASFLLFGLLNKDTLTYEFSDGTNNWSYQNGIGKFNKAAKPGFDQVDYFFRYSLSYIAPVYALKQSNDSLEFIGRIKSDGEDVYRIKAVRKSNESVFLSTFYDFNIYDLTLIRSIQENLYNNGLRDEKSPNLNPYYMLYENYKTENGFKYPTYNHQVGLFKEKELYVKIKYLKLNGTINPATFKPKN